MKAHFFLPLVCNGNFKKSWTYKLGWTKEFNLKGRERLPLQKNMNLENALTFSAVRNTTLKVLPTKSTVRKIYSEKYGP